MTPFPAQIVSFQWWAVPQNGQLRLFFISGQEGKSPFQNECEHLQSWTWSAYLFILIFGVVNLYCTLLPKKFWFHWKETATLWNAETCSKLPVSRPDRRLLLLLRGSLEAACPPSDLWRQGRSHTLTHNTEGPGAQSFTGPKIFTLQQRAREGLQASNLCL